MMTRTRTMGTLNGLLLRTGLLGGALFLSLAAGCSSAPDDGSERAGQSSADTSASCGDGTRDQGEQCDDGNTTNLDGCDSTCQFEQDNRLNSVSLNFNTDSFCASNAVGKSVGSAAQGQLQKALTTAVDSGAISILFQFLHLTDLSGTSDSSFELGGMVGTPVASGGSYDGSKDLDGWYTPDATGLNDDLTPVAQLNASFTGGELTAGPGNLDVNLAFGGSAIPVALSNVKVAAKATSATAPTEATGSSEPGHLASENLDPSLTSFGGLSGGAICGNVVAESLAAAPAPAVLLGGATSCSEGYTTDNSVLDILVGGCHVIFFTALSATQPDKVTDSSTGGPFRLSASGSDHKVDTCTNAAGSSVPLATCLTEAEYSVYLAFTADRVIVKAASGN